MRYTYAVYKTADSSTTLQMSNRVIVEHPEQMVFIFLEQMKGRDFERTESFALSRLNMRYTYAVYKTADSSTTLKMSNRVIVEHHEQMDRAIVEYPEQMVVELLWNITNSWICLIVNGGATLYELVQAKRILYIALNY